MNTKNKNDATAADSEGPPEGSTIAGVDAELNARPVFDDAETMVDPSAFVHQETQTVLPGDGYDATMVDPDAFKHQGSEKETQHVDTMEFEEPDVGSIFELEFPEITENTEQIFKRCFSPLGDILPALIYFQGDHKAGDRLITASYNDFHIPTEEESLQLIQYLEILESKKQTMAHYLSEYGQGSLREHMKYGGISQVEAETDLDRQGITGHEKDRRLQQGFISGPKLETNLKKIHLRLQVNISAIDERLRKLLEGPLFANVYYGQSVIHDVVKMTRSKVERDKRGREFIAQDESVMGVVVGNILHELAMLDPRMNVAERLLKDKVYLSEYALDKMDTYLRKIHSNKHLEKSETQEFLKYFVCIVRVQRTLDNRNDTLFKWMDTLVAASSQRNGELRRSETLIPPQHLSYEHKLVYDTYNNKLDEVLSTYIYHYYDLEHYCNILGDIVISFDELNLKYGVAETDDDSGELVHRPLFNTQGHLNAAPFDADARLKTILPYFRKLSVLVKQRDKTGFLLGAIEEALNKYQGYIDEIICAEYARTLLGLTETGRGRVNILHDIENKSRVYIQEEGQQVFETLYHLDTTIMDDEECLEAMRDYLRQTRDAMSAPNKAKKEDNISKNLSDLYRLGQRNLATHYWMEEPYGFHFRKYFRLANSRLKKVREIIVPMLARKLYMSADDMYSRYKRIKLRENVVLQDSNFELWLDHFFAVYDNPDAAKKFNSREYQLFEKIDVKGLVIQNPTIWIKEVLTQLFLLHSERQFHGALTSGDAEDFRAFLDLTFARLNDVLQKSAEKRRGNSDFNKKLVERIEQQRDSVEATALKTLMESENEAEFAREVKDSMRQMIVEKEETRQTDLSAGTKIKPRKRFLQRKIKKEGFFKKLFGGLFG